MYTVLYASECVSINCQLHKWGNSLVSMLVHVFLLLNHSLKDKSKLLYAQNVYYVSCNYNIHLYMYKYLVHLHAYLHCTCIFILHAICQVHYTSFLFFMALLPMTKVPEFFSMSTVCYSFC